MPAVHAAAVGPGVCTGGLAVQKRLYTNGWWALGFMSIIGYLYSSF